MGKEIFTHIQKVQRFPSMILKKMEKNMETHINETNEK